jgi:D-tyrosyl-tRNA(Tyr) deacylase
MVEKISHLRLFENDQGKLDRSLLDVRGAVLAVSQFTLYADCRKGRRPSFTEAAPPEVASTLIDRFLEEMAQRGVAVSSGRFGQHMEVSLVNDGPVTVWLDIPPGGQAGSGARGEIYGG